MTGRIVILNGVPRSGKSTLARAIQANVPGKWINWGVDAFNASLPETLLPGIGLRPGGERPELETALPALFSAYFGALLAFTDKGFDVVADLGLHQNYAAPFNPWAMLDSTIGHAPVLRVGVDCPIETIMARRNADPRGGFYAAGPGVPAPVQRWQDAVHAGITYDLRLDMGAMTAPDGAALVGQALRALPGR